MMLRLSLVRGLIEITIRSGVLVVVVAVVFGVGAPSVSADLPRLVVDSVMNLSSGIQHGYNEVSYVKSIRVVNGSGLPGDYFVTFSVPSGGTASRRLTRGETGLAYQLYRTPTGSVPLRDFPDVQAGEVLIGRFQSGDTQHVLEFSIRMAGEIWLPPGDYSDSVVLRLFSGTINSAVEIESQLVRFRREVAVSMDLALLNLGGAFVQGKHTSTLDFGRIDRDMERSIDCVIRSNVRYDLSFASDHGGRLVHRDGSQIPYILKIDGTPMPLSTGGEVALNSVSSPTSDGGRPHRLSVSLGPSRDQAAGDYTDNIRISIWAQ